jgi:hypothetical protein
VPTIPTGLPEQARRGLERLGLDDATLAIIGAGDDFVESEKAFREAGRMEAVRADAARVNASKAREERFNQGGIRQMQRALAELEGAPSKLDQDTQRQIRESIGTQEFRDRLHEAQAQFHDNLVSADISGGEAEEVASLWNEAQTALEEGGARRATGQRTRKGAASARGQKTPQ